MRKYAKELVTHLPEESMDIILRLCGELFGDATNAAGESPFIQPDFFIPAFVNQRPYLEKFIERIIARNDGTKVSRILWNTLLELYLNNLAADADQPESVGERIKNLLDNKQADYDPDHALVLCKSSGYRPGVLFLFERMCLFRELVNYHMENQDYESVLNSAKQFLPTDSDLWSTILAYFGDRPAICRSQLTDCIQHIEQRNLLQPLKVVDILASKSDVTLEQISDYLLRKVEKDSKTVDRDVQLSKKYLEEQKRLAKEIEEITKWYD
jgi:hypothetical protein